LIAYVKATNGGTGVVNGATNALKIKKAGWYRVDYNGYATTFLGTGLFYSGITINGTMNWESFYTINRVTANVGVPFGDCIPMVYLPAEAIVRLVFAASASTQLQNCNYLLSVTRQRN
jgi:hypothetical protein